MKNGFTLVELLAIMALLGIIIIVAMPALVQSNRIAKENTDKHLAETINTACESYIATLPDEEKAAVLNAKVVSIKTLIDNGYLKANLENSSGVDVSNGTVGVDKSEDEIVCKYTG